MNPDTQAAADPVTYVLVPGHPSRPARIVTIQALATTVLATGLLVMAAWLALHADPIYLPAALVVAAPAALALLMAAPAVGLRDRSIVAARVLGWVGLITVVLPTLMLGCLFLT